MAVRLIRLAGPALFALALALLWLTPFGQRIERDQGQSLLYRLRGPVAVPETALVIALDQESVNWLQFHADRLPEVAPALRGCLTPHGAERLAVARNIGDLPRSLHACLTRLLSQRGAALIVFDILFHVETPDDAALAEAIGDAGNVLLFERVRSEGDAPIIGGRPLVQRLHPRPLLETAAAGTGPFLVETPTANLVEGYLVRLAEFPRLPNLVELSYERLTGRAPPSAEPGAIRPFWIYGPPHTLPTIRLRDALAADSRTPLPARLDGRAVFIGVSDPEFLGTRDHFKVPVSDARQNDMGGVELAATALLNLLEDRVPVRVGRGEGAAIVGLLGLVFGLGITAVGGWRGVGLIAAVSGGYTWMAGAAFAGGPLWLPLAVPVMLGALPAMLAALALRYALARQLVGRLAPRAVAGRLLDRASGMRQPLRTEMATVMFTDLVGSTVMGERLTTEAYASAIGRYYDRAAAAIEAERGLLIEFMGDGILALFPESHAGPDHAERACRVALALAETLGAASKAPAAERFRLRISLNTGPTATGTVGTADRYNFKALGYTVNVAAKLEQLTRDLDAGTDDIIVVTGATRAACGLDESQFVDLGELRIGEGLALIPVARLVV